VVSRQEPPFSVQRRQFVRISVPLNDQLLECKRLTGIPVAVQVHNAVTYYLDEHAQGIAEKLGATPEEIEHLSQMRLGRPAKGPPSPKKPPASTGQLPVPRKSRKKSKRLA